MTRSGDGSACAGATAATTSAAVSKAATGSNRMIEGVRSIAAGW